MWLQCSSIVLEVLLSLFLNKFHSTVCSPSSITDTEHMPVSGMAALTLRKQRTILERTAATSAAAAAAATAAAANTGWGEALQRQQGVSASASATAASNAANAAACFCPPRCKKERVRCDV